MASLHHLVTVIMEVVTGSNNHQTKNMQMKRNFIYLIGVICLMTSCIGGFDAPNPMKGGEVSFSANLNSVETRTLYDAGQIANPLSGVKVNWVHNDLITIYGTTCTAVPQAEYRVGAVKVNNSNTPVLDSNGNEQPVTGQSYANYLQKTGAAGVQWGSQTTSDFYAVYPSTNYSFETTSTGAKVQTSIRTEQRNVFKLVTDEDDNECWVGTPYIQDVTNPTMVDALMYACKTGVKSTDSQVDLTFKPWSTVLKFRFEGFDYTMVGATHNTVSVKKIVLQAPSNVDIAGDLELQITRSNNSAKAVPLGEVNNTITILPDYLPLSSNQTVEFCVYTIPQDGLSFGTSDNNLWKVTIETADGTSFTYKMRPSSGNASIAAGKIHSVQIPQKKIDKVGDLTDNKDSWIEKIPRNVYLSELSVPGSWYCTDANYSGNSDLTKLYAGGVRAFHIDCRLTKGSNDDAYKLMCAGTESISNRKIQGDEVSSKLATLNTLAGQHPNEYIVAVLTIAEKTKDGTNIQGTVDPQQVLGAIQTMLSSNSLSNLYREKITSNTTVGDVLGKMIVMVNANANPANFVNWYNGTSLIAKASLAPENSGSIVAGSFTSMQESDLYWGNSATDLNYFYHHAQRTLSSGSVTGVPTYANRKTAIDDIIGESDDIYIASSHNGWFMMGIGGYRKNEASLTEWFPSENHEEVAQTLNPYLLNWINDKIAKKEGLYPSPVGIVLMNYPLEDNPYYGEELVEAIMNMNASFPLASDPTKNENTGEVVYDKIEGWAEVTTWEDVYLN